MTYSVQPLSSQASDAGAGSSSPSNRGHCHVIQAPQGLRIFENALLAGVVIVVGLAVLEMGLRMTSMSFDRREPPGWLRSLIDPQLPAMPATRESDFGHRASAGRQHRCPTSAARACGHCSRRQAAAAGPFGLAAAAAL